MKVMLDRVVAAVGLIVLIPLLLVLGLAVYLSLGWPILFVQSRPGRHGRPFRLLKFRTMRQVVERDGRPLEDAERLTALGRFMRAASLDEIPQLWNVLRGDVSLVGPRPLLMHYLPRYSREQARRHDVLPGITGWAQVNGRNAISWEQKFALDIWYVEHWSLKLDLRILFRTIVQVFRRQGISREGHATMPEFRGSEATASRGGHQ